MVVPDGECGGGLGAVAPAVGLLGPQQDPTPLLIAGESPTTSISSSSTSTLFDSIVGSSERSGHG